MKKLTIAAISALCLTLPTIAAADSPTVFKWGCEWKQAENGNYLTKVDGGCKHWQALGYSRQTDMMAVPPVEVSAPEEPEDCEPGKEEPAT